MRLCSASTLKSQFGSAVSLSLLLAKHTEGRFLSEFPQILVIHCRPGEGGDPQDKAPVGGQSGLYLTHNGGEHYGTANQIRAGNNNILYF